MKAEREVRELIDTLEMLVPDEPVFECNQLSEGLSHLRVLLFDKENPYDRTPRQFIVENNV